MPLLSDPRHELFAQELAKGAPADKAYSLAGFRPHRSNAARLSAKEHVKARVAEILGEALDRAGVTVDRVVAELAKIGFSDIRKAMKWTRKVIGTDQNTGEVDITPVNSDDLDEDTAAAIAEVSRAKDGAIRIKLHDKRAALVDLGRHLGMFPTKVEAEHGLSLSLERLIETALQKGMSPRPESSSSRTDR